MSRRPTGLLKIKKTKTNNNNNLCTSYLFPVLRSLITGLPWLPAKRNKHDYKYTAYLYYSNTTTLLAVYREFRSESFVEPDDLTLLSVVL